MDGPATTLSVAPSDAAGARPPILPDKVRESEPDTIDLHEADVLACLTRKNSRDIAIAHRRIWEARPALRAIYREYYRRMAGLMVEASHPTVEIGGGPGTFKTFRPETLSSDIVSTPWLDLAADAGSLPFAEASVGNLVMIDVLHHLPYPQRFLQEAQRVLAPGGRLVILDVYLSLMSWPIFRFLHPESASLTVRPLNGHEDQPLFDPSSPWNSDQGVARALFYKQHDELQKRLPALRMVHRERLSTLLWPLSGGFGMKDRLPRRAIGVLRVLDRWLEWLGPLTNFRCLVAFEKQPYANDENFKRKMRAACAHVFDG